MTAFVFYFSENKARQQLSFSGVAYQAVVSKRSLSMRQSPLMPFWTPA